MQLLCTLRRDREGPRDDFSFPSYCTRSAEASEAEGNGHGWSDLSSFVRLPFRLIDLGSRIREQQFD